MTKPKITTFTTLFLLTGLLITGCVTGNARLADMGVVQTRNTIKIGTTTTTDVESLLGPPRSTGLLTVRDNQDGDPNNVDVVWYYLFQKTTWKFLVPFYPISRDDNIIGRLAIGFNTSNIVMRIEYYRTDR